jgi:hypothetical protein
MFIKLNVTRKTSNISFSNPKVVLISFFIDSQVNYISNIQIYWSFVMPNNRESLYDYICSSFKNLGILAGFNLADLASDDNELSTLVEMMVLDESLPTDMRFEMANVLTQFNK